MSKVLVTGGLGLIGHNVVLKLKQLGHDVIVDDIKTNYSLIPKDELDYLMEERTKKIGGLTLYKYDIADRFKMEQLFLNTAPEIVIHLASFPRQKVVNKDPVAGSKTMSEGLLNLLELSKQNNVQKFVYISSSMVYGDFNFYILPENALNQGVAKSECCCSKGVDNGWISLYKK